MSSSKHAKEVGLIQIICYSTLFKNPDPQTNSMNSLRNTFEVLNGGLQFEVFICICSIPTVSGPGGLISDIMALVWYI